MCSPEISLKVLRRLHSKIAGRPRDHQAGDAWRGLADRLVTASSHLRQP
jgi:hypothetical protein